MWVISVVSWIACKFSDKYPWIAGYQAFNSAFALMRGLEIQPRSLASISTSEHNVLLLTTNIGPTTITRRNLYNASAETNFTIIASKCHDVHPLRLVCHEINHNCHSEQSFDKRHTLDSMVKMLLNTCHQCFRQQALLVSGRCLALPRNAAIHTSGFQAAKGTKPKAKQPQKKIQLDYK